MSNARDFFDHYGVDWSEYENALSKMELDTFEEDHIESPDYLSDRESDRDDGIVNIRLCLDSISEAIMDSLKDDKEWTYMLQIRPVSDLRNKFPDIEKIVNTGEP